VCEIEDLLELMARLRDRDTGCPWDKAQTYESIVPHTIEEAYEVADAITRGDRAELKDELGDLLFQIVFYSQLAREEGAFTFADVAKSITEKMTRRHPHVFGDTVYSDVAEQSRAWERLKEAERDIGRTSVLGGIPLALPAMTRALKLQRKAARVGFDWGNALGVLPKIEEELEEVRAEILAGADRERLQQEVGDLLFACVNLARHLNIDPEAATRGTNAKFERRFRLIEAWLAEAGSNPERASLAEMDALWERAKSEDGNELQIRDNQQTDTL
jgi:MazG family protein